MFDRLQRVSRDNTTFAGNKGCRERNWGRGIGWRYFYCCEYNTIEMEIQWYEQERRVCTIQYDNAMIDLTAPKCGLYLSIVSMLYDSIKDEVEGRWETVKGKKEWMLWHCDMQTGRHLVKGCVGHVCPESIRWILISTRVGHAESHVMYHVKSRSRVPP